jgi:polysaccharide biosynthesis/export protein
VTAILALTLALSAVPHAQAPAAPPAPVVATVTVRGVVRAPGRFTFTGTRSLTEILADAGILLAQAGPEVTIIRPNRNKAAAAAAPAARESGATADPDGDVLTVSLKDARAAETFELQDGDIVTVPELQTILVAGNVRSKGTYVWQPGLTLAEAVMLAGGLTERGTLKGASALRTAGDKQTVVKLSPSDAIQPNDQITIGRRLF